MSGSTHSGGSAGELAAGVGKGLLLKAVAAVLFSQAGIVLAVVVMGSMGLIGVLSFVSTDEPDCDTAAGPTFVSSASSEEALADIPANYLELYKQAASEYGIDWAILAAVGKIETDHGRLDAPGVTEGQNQHGCCAGPMQFHNNYGQGGGTWGAVGYDANGDGEANIYDPEDAIPSAAKYLVQGGAPEDYQSALFQYNNAQWYVDDVLAQAEKYRAAGGGGTDSDNSVPALIPALPSLMDEAHAQESTDGSGGGSGDSSSVSPLPEDQMGEYSDDWGAERPGFAGATHEGTDIFAEKGTPVRSMVSGVVEENTNNNENSYSEVGGYNVMIRATEDVGPVKKGDLLLYAHMQEPPSVGPGDEVTAGEEIGKVGATGYGPEVTRDEFDPHLHVGWYTEDESRADSPSGAMNPYPLLEWVKNNGGEAAGSETEDVAPTAAPAPEECKSPSGTGTGSGKGSGEVLGSASGKAVLEEARKYDGTAYKIYACEPGSLMDCSCLTMTAFKKFGISLPWPVMDQTNYGKPVEGEPQAGDLIFYGPGGGYPGHVGIANGEGGIFHCASPALGCLESPDYKTAGPTPVMEVRRLVDGSEGGSGGGGQ